MLKTNHPIDQTRTPQSVSADPLLLLEDDGFHIRVKDLTEPTDLFEERTAGLTNTGVRYSPSNSSMFLGLHALRDIDTISQYVSKISSKKFDDVTAVAAPKIAQEKTIYSVVQPDALNHVMSNKKVRNQIFERLEELEMLGTEEDLSMSKNSLDDFIRFLKEYDPTVHPFLSMVLSGNIRVLWDHDDGRQIGLQFLGGGRIQYVVFMKRRPDGLRASDCGRVQYDAVHDLMSKDFLDLLYA